MHSLKTSFDMVGGAYECRGWGLVTVVLAVNL